MAILRWRPMDQSMDPFREVVEIQSEMNRLFSGLFGRPANASMTRDRAWAPPLDMEETKDELVVTAELPGVEEKAINLSITGDLLTLRGERMGPEPKAEGAYRGERWFGRFERTVSLPFPVQADKVKATYRDGVLTITLPKVEEIKPREIKIEVQ
jgi:HSP20 family protein